MCIYQIYNAYNNVCTIYVYTTGFHTSFVAAVRAFAQGDGELVNAALTNAQAHVAKQLGSMLPEGHASFNHAVVQLQLATTVGYVYVSVVNVGMCI